jgi:hypothetical protein
MLSNGIGRDGFGIDRFQRIRGLGSSAWVTAYDSAYGWFRARLQAMAIEAHYWNFEVDRQDFMDTETVTEIEMWGPNTADPGDDGVIDFEDRIIAGYHDVTVDLPGAANMATFDTLEIDVLFECPDRNAIEFGNCGAWDYLAYTKLWDPETETWLEMARYITTYHRESWWVIDATHALAWLKDGGERTFRIEWAPSWNVQPTAITSTLRLSNRGKGYRPTQVIPLHQGGTFNEAYNDREAVEVEVPETAAHLELRAIITGHGNDSQGCAEFCAHGHEFTIGTFNWSHVYGEASTNEGCSDRVADGVPPNQYGTWWFGRGGWCPGEEVHPWVHDLDADVRAGDVVEVQYEGSFRGAAPTSVGSDGNILMNSWIVVYE